VCIMACLPPLLCHMKVVNLTGGRVAVTLLHWQESTLHSLPSSAAVSTNQHHCPLLDLCWTLQWMLVALQGSAWPNPIVAAAE
jgi:hypothetical protein